MQASLHHQEVFWKVLSPQPMAEHSALGCPLCMYPAERGKGQCVLSLVFRAINLVLANSAGSQQQLEPMGAGTVRSNSNLR